MHMSHKRQPTKGRHMSTETTLNEVRTKLIHNAKPLGIEVVYAEYDFETSQWNIELRLEQTLPPNRDNTSEVRVVECITNRVQIRLDHNLEGGTEATDKVHRQLQILVGEFNIVGVLGYRQARDNRIQHRPLGH